MRDRATMLRENSVGTLPPQIPLYVAQGGQDVLVLPAATREFVARQCAAGVHVVFHEYPDDTHGSVGLAALRGRRPDLLEGLADVLATAATVIRAQAAGPADPAPDPAAPAGPAAEADDPPPAPVQRIEVA